jgi:hypothetical protein
MHTNERMMRILIFLLILRVLAAPIAARPDCYRPLSKTGFIIRVCMWPAQGPQRLTASSTSLPSEDSRGQGERMHGFLSTTACTLISPIRAHLFHQVTVSFHDLSAFRLNDSPRC